MYVAAANWGWMSENHPPQAAQEIPFYLTSPFIEPADILCAMGEMRNLLRERCWGLKDSRLLAREIAVDKAAVRALVRELFGEEVAVRKRAADVARRITERDAAPLEHYADELAGLLELLLAEESPKQADSQTRWHLALVVARVAHTRLQRLRAARILSLLADSESNAVRCSAVEGLATLALGEPSLRGEADAMVERFLWNGTPAMKARARHAQKMLKKL